MIEEWKVIKGTIYSVSKKGEVKNNKTQGIIKPYISITGYKYIGLCINGKTTNKRLGRLVYKTYKCLRKGYHVHHIKEKTNDSLQNLKGVSNSRHYRIPKKHKKYVILSKDEREEIRLEGLTIKQAMILYKISYLTVINIRHEKKRNSSSIRV